MDTHPQLDSGIVFERSVDLQRTLHGRLGTGEKYQSHPIARGQTDQLLFRFSSADLLAVTNNSRESLRQIALLIDQQF